MKLQVTIKLFILLFITSSCSDWLDLQPEGESSSKELFSSGNGYRSVLNGIYKNMGDANLYGSDLQFGLVDCMSQQYSVENNDQMPKYITEALKFNFEAPELTTRIGQIWRKGYNVIANSNELIQNISQASEDLFAEGEMERKMIMGEAYACRALMHFDLLRLFAPAPINDDGGNYIPYVDVFPSITATGEPVNSVLEKCIADLKLAESLVMTFDTTGFGKSVNASGKSRFFNTLEYGMEGANSEQKLDGFFMGRGYRLSSYAITALLARVYQYAGMNKEALEHAQKALDFKVQAVGGSEFPLYSKDDFSGYQWEEDPERRSDKKAVSNLIFGIYNERAYYAESEGGLSLEHFFQKKSEGQNRGWWLTIATEGQKIFYNTKDEDERENDIRYKRLIFKADNYYEISCKWYLNEDPKMRDDDLRILPVLRATELRYIIAEEYARQSRFDEAYTILNEIRSARELWTPLPVQSDFVLFQKDLIRDAQREWISEGQLFYLYKRLDAPIRRNEVTELPLSRSEWKLPIPQTETL